MPTCNESKVAFLKAPPTCVKKCGPIQYQTAESCLAQVGREIAEKDEFSGHLSAAIGITRERSLEAIKICKVPSAPTPTKLVSLQLSSNKYLQGKFSIPDDRIMVKCHGSERLLQAIELQKSVLRTEGRSSECFPNLRLEYS